MTWIRFTSPRSLIRKNRRTTVTEAALVVIDRAIPFSDLSELSEEDAALDQHIYEPEDQYLQIATPIETGAPFKVPDDVLAILRQCSDEITARKWISVRTILAYLDELPKPKAQAYRADVIKQSADALQVEETTLREWVHTGEVFPAGIEEAPRYAGWGFSLFSRAARMSETALALNVLEIARERQEAVSPGRPPRCWIVDQVVKEQKERVNRATENEIDQLRAEAERRGRLRFIGRAFHSALMGRTVILVPDGKDIKPGDDVFVIKRDRDE